MESKIRNGRGDMEVRVRNQSFDLFKKFYLQYVESGGHFTDDYEVRHVDGGANNLVNIVAKIGKLEYIQFMHENGEKFFSNHQWLPLKIAIKYKKWDVVEFLWDVSRSPLTVFAVDGDAKPSWLVRREQNLTMYMKFAADGDWEGMSACLRIDPAVRKGLFNHTTAAMFAVSGGYDAILDHLIEQNLLLPDHDSMKSILLTATHYGNVNVVETILLNRRHRPFLKQEALGEDKTPEDYLVILAQEAAIDAAMMGSLEVLKWLLTTESLRHLTLGRSAKDQRERTFGYTVLMWAVERNHLSMVEWLIRHHIVHLDLDATNHFGRTVVDMGVSSMKYFKLLVIEGGANVGRNFSYVGEHYSHDLEVLKWILDLYPFLDREDLLARAISEKHNLTTIQWLVEKGRADPMKVTVGDIPAMMYAFDGKGPFVYGEWLVKSGRVDVNQRLNHRGETALMLAARQKRLDIFINLVETGGADVDMVDNDGSSIWSKIPIDEDVDFLHGMLYCLLPRKIITHEFWNSLDEDLYEFVATGIRVQRTVTRYLEDRKRAFLDSTRFRMTGVLQLETLGFDEGTLTTEEMWDMA
jgi:ankyrin repeat protein